MLNLNFGQNMNFGQNNFGGSSCGCHAGGGFGGGGSYGMNPGFGGGYGQASGLGQMGQMDPMSGLNGQMANLFNLSMLNMMAQLLQMLSGGSPLSGGANQFGGGDASGSPLDSFLGGGGGGGGGGSSPVGGGGGGSSSVGGGGGGGSAAPASGGGSAASAPSGNVDPSSVKDKTSTSGLSTAAKAGLEQAHSYGLPLVSGKRSGSGTSDHNHGDAIDVGTLPIGAASSNGGTPEMKAFAEKMRLEGKAGKSKVKYIIRDGQIASSKGNWEWRPYIYPGQTQASLDALKKKNPGEYNRIQHFDHVHVSFND